MGRTTPDMVVGRPVGVETALFEVLVVAGTYCIVKRELPGIV